MEMHIISDGNRFASLKDSWNRLATDVGTSFFSSFEWCHLYWQNIRPQPQLSLIVFQQGKEVVGLVPLAYHGCWPWRRYEFIGGNDADYHEFLIYPQCRDEGFARLQDFFSRKYVRFHNVPDDSLTSSFLQSGNFPAAGCLQKPDIAPFLSIDCSWEEYLRRVKKRLVQDSRRQLRRLGRLGEICFHQAATPSEIEEFINILEDFKARRRYREKISYNPLEARGRKVLLKKIAVSLAASGGLDLSLLQVGAEPVAIHFGFTFRERYYYYIPSFSMKFQAYSPGRILMLRSMERAFKDGLTEFDFLRGDEPYKFDWANGARRLTTLVSYPVSWSGHGARCWEEYLRPQAANSQLIRHLWKQVRKILGR